MARIRTKERIIEILNMVKEYLDGNLKPIYTQRLDEDHTRVWLQKGTCGFNFIQLKDKRVWLHFEDYRIEFRPASAAYLLVDWNNKERALITEYDVDRIINFFALHNWNGEGACA